MNEGATRGFLLFVAAVVFVGLAFGAGLGAWGIVGGLLAALAAVVVVVVIHRFVLRRVTR